MLLVSTKCQLYSCNINIDLKCRTIFLSVLYARSSCYIILLTVFISKIVYDLCTRSLRSQIQKLVNYKHKAAAVEEVL